LQICKISKRATLFPGFKYDQYRSLLLQPKDIDKQRMRCKGMALSLFWPMDHLEKMQWTTLLCWHLVKSYSLLLYNLLHVKVANFRNVLSSINGTLCGSLEFLDHVDNHWCKGTCQNFLIGSSISTNVPLNLWNGTLTPQNVWYCWRWAYSAVLSIKKNALVDGYWVILITAQISDTTNQCWLNANSVAMSCYVLREEIVR